MGKLPKNVADAVDSADNDCGLELTYLTRDEWQTIRAELTRLAEIAESVDPLVVRLGEVTTRLEAANALLREIMEFGEDRRLHIRIQAHLSENGHV